MKLERIQERKENEKPSHQENVASVSKKSVLKRERR